MSRAARGLAGVALVAALVLTGCTVTTASDEPAAPPTTASDGVKWGDYAPTLKADLNKLAAARDCTELQAQFDAADTNSSATRERTGHGNGELMAYVDAAMTSAGCYS